MIKTKARALANRLEGTLARGTSGLATLLQSLTPTLRGAPPSAPSREPVSPGSSGRLPEGVRITHRKMKFEFESAGFDKHWHGGSPFITYFWNAMSAAFPAGEGFFVNAAMSVRGRIQDDELLRELDEFVRQEGHHSFQHMKFNNLVAKQGLSMARYEKRYAVPLKVAADNLRPMQKLAVTMALEHFTAVVAHRVMSNPALLRGADPAVSALWLWHAAEELEHKSTCFDLYERLGGRYRTRVRALRATVPFELYLVLQNTYSMLREDGHLFDVRDQLRGFWYLLGPNGFLTGMLPGLVSYLSPHFRPWQLDDSHLITEWAALNGRYIKNLDRSAGGVARLT